MALNLYLLSQDVNCGYDTFDSVVVAAESPGVARKINPGGENYWGKSYSSWCMFPDQVKVELIGTAVEGTEPGIILSSFNAG